MAGLYLHIPFCRRKCPYCDFFSVETDSGHFHKYAELLTRHLDWAAQKEWSYHLETIYFGGGTPSLLSPATIATILTKVRQNYEIADNAEVTLEANPATISHTTLAGYREAGVNRLSLGLQSCNPKQLAQLGRAHSVRDGIDALNMAREAGFDNLSLDLMFALPDQTLSELDEEIDRYLALAPEHLSCYGLTAEPGTPLHKKITDGTMALPDEDFYAEAFMRIHDRLTAAGYDHYEIANYARDGYSSRHNMNYWQRCPYLGIGAGAHSFYDDQWGSRWQVPTSLSDYYQALQDHQEPMRCIETFNRESALRETIYLALRTRRGISDGELQQRFGCTLQEAFPEAVEASAQWLVNDAGRWSLAPPGWLIFDHLILAFL